MVTIHGTHCFRGVWHAKDGMCVDAFHDPNNVLWVQSHNSLRTRGLFILSVQGIDPVFDHAIVLLLEGFPRLPNHPLRQPIQGGPVLII